MINNIITKDKKIDEVYEGKVEFIYLFENGFTFLKVTWNFIILILGILRTFKNV